MVDSHFTSVEEVEKSIVEFIDSKQSFFFRNGIRQFAWKIAEICKKWGRITLKIR